MEKVFVMRPDFPCNGVNLLKEKFNVVCNPKIKMDREEIMKLVEGSFAIFCFPSPIRIDKDFLDRAGPNLKVIATYSVGFDYMDVEEIKRRGIRIGYTPNVPTEACAEMIMTLLLAVTRRLHEGMEAVKCGDWATSWAPLWLCGMPLQGSTVGIIGFGRIGQSVARKLKSFDISCLLYTARTEKTEASELGGCKVDLDTLMAKSDFVIVTLALNDETRNTISEEKIGLMKKTAILINAARGELVDQEALVNALKEGRIGGAGLDVTSPEPLPRDSPLLDFDNVVVTPHLASATYEARFAMAEITAQNIIAVYEGTKMPFELL